MPYNKGAWDVHAQNIAKRPRPVRGRLPGQGAPPSAKPSPKKPWSRAGSVLSKINPFD